MDKPVCITTTLKSILYQQQNRKNYAYTKVCAHLVQFFH